MSDLKMPKFLIRKDNPVTPATPEERAAFLAKAAPVETKPAPDPVVERIDADEVRKKKARQAARNARYAVQKEIRDIPKKYLGWDTKLCKFYDTRKGKPSSTKKENVMTAKKKSNGKDKKVVTRFKKSATSKSKATTKAKATAAKPARAGSKREKIIAMLRRDNGASLAELLKANPLSGKTPLNTIAAMISVMSKTMKVERVGDAKGEQRRFRITG